MNTYKQIQKSLNKHENQLQIFPETYPKMLEKAFSGPCLQIPLPW